MGNFTISVFSEPDANPGDIYTLKVIDGGKTYILAEDAPVGDISDQDIYGVAATGEGIKLIKLFSPKNRQTLAGPVSFNWEGIGYDKYRIQFSTSKKFKGKTILTFPDNGWISEKSFMPDKSQWKQIDGMDLSDIRYWRVIGKGNERIKGYSELRQFSIDRESGDSIK
jgi:hypothetical protein